jgi:hypothetical protein
MWRTAVVGLAVAASGCGSRAPTRPSTTAPTLNVGFPGKWAGTLTDRDAGTGTIAFALTGYVPDIASGSMTVTVAGVTATGMGSVLRGTTAFSCGVVGGANGSLVVSGDSLSGDLSFLDCGPLTKVTFQAQRQPQ